MRFKVNFGLGAMSSLPMGHARNTTALYTFGLNLVHQSSSSDNKYYRRTRRIFKRDLPIGFHRNVSCSETRNVPRKTRSLIGRSPCVSLVRATRAVIRRRGRVP